MNNSPEIYQSLGAQVSPSATAFASQSLAEILKLLTELQKQETELQQMMTNATKDTALALASSACTEIQKQADATMSQGLGQIFGGFVTAGAGVYGAYQSFSGASQIRDYTNQIKGKETAAIEAKTAAATAEEVSEEAGAEVCKDGEVKFQFKPKRNGAEGHTSESANGKGPGESIEELKRKREKVDKDVASKTATTTALGQGFGQMSIASGNLAAQEAQREQALADYSKTLANAVLQMQQEASKTLDTTQGSFTSEKQYVGQIHDGIAASNRV
jgi:hypothetical protein